MSQADPPYTTFPRRVLSVSNTSALRKAIPACKLPIGTEMTPALSRRALIAIAAGLPACGAAAPAAAFAAGEAQLGQSQDREVSTAAAASDADAELIRLCDGLIDNQGEIHHLLKHDPFAPDYGPNHRRLEILNDEYHAISGQIWDDCQPKTRDGQMALAQAALACAERDLDDEVECRELDEFLLFSLAESLVPGFVWPPAVNRAWATRWHPAAERIPPRPQMPIAEYDKVMIARLKSCCDPAEYAAAVLSELKVSWTMALGCVTEGTLTLDRVRNALPGILDVVPAQSMPELA